MTPDIACQEPLEDLETLVRLAGDYVHPSDDLRPRVLEAARAVRRDREARRRIMQMAAVLFAAALAAACAYGPGLPESAAEASLWSVDVNPASPSAGAPGDSGWEMVDSFTELRRCQARLLRLAL